MVQTRSKETPAAYDDEAVNWAVGNVNEPTNLDRLGVSHFRSLPGCLLSGRLDLASQKQWTQF